ncbi:Hpt domain-containing protein [Picosynechococcus sp. NKBG15041c]|uniref:Hpt domain-containing protein n=1 Tax=Picosynechococcus sp. NKBG15041c TaxID=1407650 RepID=UPI0004070BE3|nr:Hpt domain-containing protein [Picosynechococcus sp. NKBG15041c]
MASQPSAADEIDLKGLAELVSYDLEVMRDLVETFLSDTPTLLTAMAVGLAQHSQPEVVRNAHTLKSSSRLFRLEQFAHQCQALETAATAADWALVTALLRRLNQDYQAIAISLTDQLPKLESMF